MGSKLEALSPPITATDLEGKIIPCVTHRIVPVTLIILRNHVVNVTLSAHKIPLVLGYQVLHFHNPQIDPQTSSGSVTPNLLSAHPHLSRVPQQLWSHLVKKSP